MNKILPLLTISLVTSLALSQAAYAGQKQVKLKDIDKTYTAGAEHNEHCRAVNKEEVLHLFDQWNASLQTGDTEKVVANYADSSILLPTLSNKPRLTHDEKVDYFQHFLAKKPVGKIESSDIELDCNTAFDAGIYKFAFADGSEARARYTFTYKWFPEKKAWLITSHHSSLMPEKEATN